MELTATALDRECRSIMREIQFLAEQVHPDDRSYSYAPEEGGTSLLVNVLGPDNGYAIFRLEVRPIEVGGDFIPGITDRQSEPPAPVEDPEVWEGLRRLVGLSIASRLHRPSAIEFLRFHPAAKWVYQNPGPYAQGALFGFRYAGPAEAEP